jgi:hypothetical protein
MSSRIRIESPRARQVREAEVDAALLPVLVAWRRLAARAWEGYLAEGPGTVTVDIGDDVAFGYRLGAPCDCHAGYVDDYDPELQVVLLVRCGESEWIYVLGGWPSPPEAFACVTAAEAEATLH